MEYTKDGVYKWCALFDTHNANYYLDEKWNIIWIESDKINNEIHRIWEITDVIICWYIWNPILFSINNIREDISKILSDVTISYSSRIWKWVKVKKI